VADIGLIGGLAGKGADRREVYNLFVGGGMGRSPKLARRIGVRLSAEKAASRVQEYLSQKISK